MPNGPKTYHDYRHFTLNINSMRKKVHEETNQIYVHTDTRKIQYK